MTRWKLEEDKNIVNRLNVFRQLLRKEQPMAISDKDQLSFAALEAEIQRCTEVLHNYPEKITWELQTMLEIHGHIVSMQKEQGKLLSQVPPLRGANNG